MIKLYFILTNLLRTVYIYDPQCLIRRGIETMCEYLEARSDK